MNDNIIFIKDFLENIVEINDAVFAGKTNKSILIGPYTANNFQFNNFHKRITSSCLYNKKMYKKISKKMALKFIQKNNIDYKLLNNKMIEYYKNGNIVVHEFIDIPHDDYYEKSSF